MATTRGSSKRKAEEVLSAKEPKLEEKKTASKAAPKAAEVSAEPTEDKKPAKKLKAGIAVGDMIPDVIVETDEEIDVNLRELTAENGIVIFFYPKASTPGCTQQACGFRDNFEQFTDAGFKVYGMSGDKAPAQAKFRSKFDMPFGLLCDPSGDARKALGVFKAGGSTVRSHLIFGKGGLCLDAQIQVGPKVSVDSATEFVSKL